MSTTNPFGKLKVERDESSDEDFKEVKDNKVVKNQESKKKKKVRPQQQEQEKEKEKNISDDEEGFEEVNKHQKKNYQREKSDYEEYEKKDYYSKKVKKDYHIKDDSRPNKKREFERKSGTGRGKEISKGGAGGKGTWGNNPKEISRRYEKNSDDYYFEQALNPKPKRERKEKNYYNKKYDKNDKNEN